MGQAASGGGMSLAATGFKLYGDYLSSRGEAQGDIYKAEVLEQQAQYGELKATQTNAQMTRNLAITLGHIDAVRAAAHTDPSSPTGAAIRGETEMIGTERKGIAVENILQQVRSDEAGAAYARNQAHNALLTGNVAMLADAFGAAAGAIKGMGGTPTPDYSQVLPGGAPLGHGGIGSA
jgi:hypothetical protein